MLSEYLTRTGKSLAEVEQEFGFAVPDSALPAKLRLVISYYLSNGRPPGGVGTWTRENTPQRIRAIMEKLSLTRAELAGELDTSYTCVCHWLTGFSVPAVRHQARIAHLILTLKPKPAPEPEPTTSLLNVPFSVSSWTKQNTPERIKAIMAFRKWKQARIARSYMVHPATVSAWVHGQRIPPPLVRVKIQELVEAEAAKPKEMDASDFLMANKDSA